MKLLCGIALFFVIIAAILLTFSSFSTAVLLGVLVAFLGGTSSFVYFKQSQALIKKVPLSSTQILAVRFYLSIIVIFIFMPKQDFVKYLTLYNSFYLILLAFLSLIIPLYFQQKALERISSEQNAIIMSLTPVVTAFIEEAIFKNVDFQFLAVYILYTLIIAASYLFNREQKKGRLGI